MARNCPPFMTPLWGPYKNEKKPRINMARNCPPFLTTLWGPYYKEKKKAPRFQTPRVLSHGFHVPKTSQNRRHTTLNPGPPSPKSPSLLQGHRVRHDTLINNRCSPTHRLLLVDPLGMPGPLVAQRLVKRLAALGRQQVLELDGHGLEAAEGREEIGAVEAGGGGGGAAEGPVVRGRRDAGGRRLEADVGDEEVARHLGGQRREHG